MAYFLPSFFQKRLLRYALSRLELIDTEALDPDSLGIRWGQRSSVELRDVSLKLDKIVSLLHLPPSSELLSARVKYLQITVPADIYSSSIICEARGIDIHLRLRPEDSMHDVLHGNDIRHLSTYDQDSEQIIPTPAGLAESFLQTEPEQEKKQLQAAISSRSLVGRRGSVSSDDEEELGIGNDRLSLPSFLAGFLKRVVDRLQVKVNDISIRVDMELNQEWPFNNKKSDVKPEFITAGLSIQEVRVDAVSKAFNEHEIPHITPGRRLVSLSGMNAMLISEPSFFSIYSRFSVPTSPLLNPRSEDDRQSSRTTSPAPPVSSSSRASPDSSAILAMTRSTILEPRLDLTSSQQPLEESTYTSDGRFSDAVSDTDDRGHAFDGYLDISDSHYDRSVLDHSAYLDSVMDSHFAEGMEDSMTLDSQDQLQPSTNGDDILLSTSKHRTSDASPKRFNDIANSDHHDREAMMFHSMGVPATDIEPEIASSQPFAEELFDALHDQTENAAAPAMKLTSPISDSENNRFGAYSPVEDLSESKIFSHDEARSMYMSAISQTATAESVIPGLPGAWDSPNSKNSSRVNFDRYGVTVSPEVASLGSIEQDKNESPTLTLERAAQPSLSEADNSGAREKPSEESLVGVPDSGSSGSHQIETVSKKFLEVDQIRIWLPCEERMAYIPTNNQSTQHERPTSMDCRGSLADMSDSLPCDDMLRMNASATSRLRRASVESDVGQSPPSAEKKEIFSDTVSEESELSVEVGSVTVQFDFSTGCLFAKMCQKLLRAFGGQEEVRKETDQSEPKKSCLRLVFSLEHFNVRFLDQLRGCTSISEVAPSTYPSAGEVLLHLTISSMKSSIRRAGSDFDLRLDVEKVAIGFASEDLLSLDESLKMRESTRDILSPVHGDVSFSMHTRNGDTRISIGTLPVHLNLNIQRLEEVLNWVGGLSTILELGSSISSTSTVRGLKHEPIRRARAVHFEATPSPLESTRPSSKICKINARVGGVILDIVGETHQIQLKTTAVKVVSRFEGIGIQIDKAKLRGPMSHDDTEKAPVKVAMSNIRVEYLFAPKEVDLDRLLALITPSKDKYDEDDDIILDTLFRQRREGPVLRTTIAEMKINIRRNKEFDSLSQLGSELSRLSTVTKYLPEDDRPGLLSLTLIKEIEGQIQVGEQIGYIHAQFKNLEVAYISIPSLVASQVGTIAMTRNETEELIGGALACPDDESTAPMLMARFIADDMDPTLRIKLNNLRAEYSIPSLIAFFGIDENPAASDLAAKMADSLVNLADMETPGGGVFGLSGPAASRSDRPKSPAAPRRLAVVLRDCLLGLNPRDNPARALVVFTNAKFTGANQEKNNSEATFDIKKATVMVIDDVQNVGHTDNLHPRSSAVVHSGQVKSLISLGYVPVCYVSSAMAVMKLICLSDDGTKSVDVELRDDLLILETCADSTQTLVNVLNGLQPPNPPSTILKYRTEVMPIQDMLASFSGDAFATEPSLGFGEEVFQPHGESSGERAEHEDDDDLEYVSDFYPLITAPDSDALAAGTNSSHNLLDSFHSTYHVTSSMSDLDFQEDHFAKKSAVEGTAHRWDSAHNTYGLSNNSKLQKSPLRVRVRDVNVIWNLFDGYDWQRTRETISRTVKNVEQRAIERRARATSRISAGIEDEEDSVIGDFLFNSIYIGISANRDPRELNQEINRNIDDLVSETGSYATSTTVTGVTSRRGRSPSLRGKKLRLYRSTHHKMTIELKRFSADLVVFPPGSGETQSSLDVRIRDLEIFDHVPTSTWKKFATYMHEAGEKESGTSMVHLEMLTVKPVPDLAASEIVMKATVLPLRLHVDQDALDFMSRFFEFRDESVITSQSAADVPFLQRVEINAVPVKLDFKPKRVDYAGLRSGRTTEFMNFFVLDGADMLLRHVIVYGVSGFDKLGQTLNDIWMPDIKRNQLPSVLAGLAPIRSLVNVGGSVKDLVVIPMREYRKDGRIVRSIQKGAMAFAKTSATELVKLGAKLAIGTQTVLQGAEDMLNFPGAQIGGAEEDSADEEETKVSPYADQPVGVVQGLRTAFRGLERDLLMARDAIVAVPGEVVDSGSAKAAAKAVWKRAPTVILRPAIGVSKAVGQTLLGAGNTLDPSNRRKAEDKYKRH